MDDMHFSFKIENPPAWLPIGRTAENDWRTIEIDCSYWFNMDATGNVVLMYRPSCGMSPYPLLTERDGDNIVWRPKSGELVEGVGRLQAFFEVGTDVIGSSDMISCEVDSSLLGVDPGTDPGQTDLPWALDIIEQIAELSGHYPKIIDGDLYIWDSTLNEWVEFEASGGGAVDSVNGKTGVVVLDAEDVGALPSSTSIPTKVSDLTNDSNFQTAAQVQNAIAAIPDELPSVTASDNGKVLGVVNGEWAVKSDEGGSSVTVDDALSTTSTNPVQNKVVKAALDGKADASALAAKQDALTAGQNVTISGNTISADVDSAEIASNVANWLNANVNPVGSAVVVDSSLSIDGAAADAKVTGNAIGAMLNGVNVDAANLLTYTDGQYISKTGVEGENANFRASDYWSIAEGKTCTFTIHETSVRDSYVRVIAYDSGKTFDSCLLEYNIKDTISHTFKFTIPPGVAYVRFSMPKEVVVDEFSYAYGSGEGLISEIQTELNETSETANDTAVLLSFFDKTHHESVNLLNPDEIEENCYYWTDGRHSSTSYSSTPLIPAEPGQKFYLQTGYAAASSRSNKTLRFCVGYDENGAVVASSAQGSQSPYTVPSGVAYVRFGVANNYLGASHYPTLLVSEDGAVLDYIEWFEPYDTYALKESANSAFPDLTELKDTAFSGKNLVGLDSSIYYPIDIEPSCTLTMSTADGEALGQSGLDIEFYDANKNILVGTSDYKWNFNSANSKRTFTYGAQKPAFAKWSIDPVRPVQLEVGDTPTEYQPYSLNIRNAKVIREVLGIDGLPALVGERSFISDYNTKDPAEYAKAYNATVLDASSDTEQFLFYTDPHLATSGADAATAVMKDRTEEDINFIQAVYNSSALSFLLCGGDWLGNSDVPEDAANKLAYIDGMMRKKFENYVPIIGNHDTNYQGKADSESATGTGKIPDSTLVNLWQKFREERRAYYRYDAPNSHIYVFDTGVENETVGTYQNAQLDWFANSLLSDNSPHIIIALHILYPNTISSGTIEPLTDKVFLIAQAYNARSMITNNGNTYDYSTSTGKVSFGIAGHTHRDTSGVLHDIPFVVSMDGTAQGAQEAGLSSDRLCTFDMCLADFGTKTLKLLRVGYGENRTIGIL